MRSVIGELRAPVSRSWPGVRPDDDRDRHAPDADLERLLAHDPIETRVHRVGDPLAARDREGGGVGLVVVDHGEVAIQTISRVQSSSS